MARTLPGWKVATIRGVSLKIHPSLLIILGYIALVASLQFPLVVSESGVDPALISGPPWAWGLSFGIGLFASVALHEFGHVLMAQSLGIKVEGVTLMLLGGVSEMEQLPDNDARAELKVSLLGPLVSFALGALLLALASWNAIPAEASIMSSWLGRANIALGVFNLLPAFPLDGGRAFRAVLSLRMGMARATDTAVTVSRGLAWVLGIVALFTFNFLLILIAVFVHMAASRELTLAVSRGLVRGLRVADAMIRTEPLTEEDTLRSVATRMLGLKRRVLAVRSSSAQPAGVVTLSDLYRTAPARWAATRAAEIMTRPTRSLDAGEALDEVLPDLAAAGALPVTEEGRLVGAIQYQDVAELLEFRGLQDPGRRAA